MPLGTNPDLRTHPSVDNQVCFPMALLYCSLKYTQHFNSNMLNVHTHSYENLFLKFANIADIDVREKCPLCMFHFLSVEKMNCVGDKNTIGC